MAAMITTEDNPYDPRDDFPHWYAWDLEHGYNTCAYLARITTLLPGQPEILDDYEVERAINEIIEIHNGGFYKKLPILDVA